MNNIKRIALTLGESAGIGPDICIKIAQLPQPAQIVVVGSPILIEQRAKLLNLPIKLKAFDPESPPQCNGNGELEIYPISLPTPCIPGVLNSKNSAYVLESLTAAYHLCEQKICYALVTGPINKQIINQSGVSFSGHTEFLQDLAQASAVLMVFYTPAFIVGLATTHCALDQVSHSLTKEKLTQSLTLLHEGLVTVFKIPDPKINVCGLNPHAGEGGLLGKEEQTLITPILHNFRKKGWQITGPSPADTVFSPENRQKFDAVLAMYHDQGLAPIKALYFNEIVNITLGLPFLRTSVDHGTALDIAGTQKANPLSLQKAIQTATRFCFSPRSRAYA